MVVSTAKVQKIWEQFTTRLRFSRIRWRCFDCKSTKNLRAIHNWKVRPGSLQRVVSTAKVQKIWEQFTTLITITPLSSWLFRLQKYKKFESNSQQFPESSRTKSCCFDCKSTKNLRAIHNSRTTSITLSWLFRLQKYKKFESNSQLKELRSLTYDVVSTAKVQKIWEQFTTQHTECVSLILLFRLQKYKKFESNSQRPLRKTTERSGCFDCKSTKNLRAIHNCW